MLLGKKTDIYDKAQICKGMAEIYEKARYSQEECTAGDIKRAKEK